MNFLRKNLFYVGLIAAFLVAVIVALVLKSSPDSDNEASLDVRVKLLDRIKRLSSSGGRINAKVNELEKKRVEDYRDQAKNVSDMSMQLNNRNLLPLVLRYSDKDVPVFPIKNDEFYNKGTYGMVSYYAARLEDLRNQSICTTRPSQEEIKVETERQDNVARAAANLLSATPTPTMAPTPVYMATPTPTPMATPTPTMMPADKALIIVRMQKAQKGRIYIDPEAMHKAVQNASASVSMAKAWEMQLSLWVQSDILAAINQTNDQVMRIGGQVKKDIVANAAVKRLEKIEVNTAYVGSTATPTGTPMPVDRGPAAPMYPSDPMTGGDMSGGDWTGGSTAVSLTTPVGAALGDRTSNTNYDVIRYKFQVVMPVRHLNRLLQNLMSRNYHVVVNIEQAEVSEDPKDPKDGVYYYGTEPVMHVTIDAQLLLLTNWERGLALVPQPQGAKEKVWQYPPLMPVEVLNLLPKTALRPDDNERISAAAATPTPR